MTPREALDRIAALCDEGKFDTEHDWEQVRAVLAAVSPEPDEVLVGDSWFKREDLPTILGNYMRSSAEAWREVKALSQRPAGGVFDRDQALQVLTSYGCEDVPAMDSFLSALAECVRPAAIDRDALIEFIRTTPFEFEGIPQYTEEEYADMILALVRPVAIDREALCSAVGSVLVHASNFPRKVQPHILGRDMGPLIASVVDAVVAKLEADDFDG